MRNLTEDKYKKNRERILSVVKPVKKVKEEKPEPVDQKYTSIVKFLEIVADYLVRLKNSVDALGNTENERSSQIANEIKQTIKLHTDDSAKEWNFHVVRDRQGRISDIKAERIE